MEILMSVGIYVLIAAALVGVAIGGIWLKKKFNISKDELEFANLILQIVDKLFQKGNLKYKGEVSTIVNYTIEAIAFVTAYEQTETLHQQKELIIEKALEICEENGIKPDQELLALVEEVANFFIKSK